MNKAPVPSFPRAIIAAFVGTILAMLAAGALFYYHQRESTRQDAKNDLESIARLKVDQIIQWRNEKLAEASVFMERATLTGTAARYIEKPAPNEGERLLARFRPLQRHSRFNDLLLVNGAGKVLLSLSGRQDSLHEEMLPVLAAALRERRPMLTDLHNGSGDVPPHIVSSRPSSRTTLENPNHAVQSSFGARLRTFCFP